MKDNKSQFHGMNSDDRLKARNEKVEKKKSKKGNFDPNKPKRPASPFFLFLDDFRREFNAANPDNKSVGAVGKAAGKKWKSMTEEDKEPFAALARTKKTEYAINIQQYNMKLANGTNTTGDDDSDKPMAEVNDEKEIASVTSDKEIASEEANGTNTTGDVDSDKPKAEVNDEKEIASATSDKENASEEEKEGDDKEVGAGICV